MFYIVDILLLQKILNVKRRKKKEWTTKESKSGKVKEQWNYEDQLNRKITNVVEELSLIEKKRIKKDKEQKEEETKS